MIAGGGMVPADTVPGRLAQVERIRRVNCSRGCERAGGCGLLARVLAGGADPIGSLLDDGAQIHCLDRHQVRIPPARARALEGAVEPTLFDELGELG